MEVGVTIGEARLSGSEGLAGARRAAGPGPLCPRSPSGLRHQKLLRLPSGHLACAGSCSPAEARALSPRCSSTCCGPVLRQTCMCSASGGQVGRCACQGVLDGRPPFPARVNAAEFWLRPHGHCGKRMPTILAVQRAACRPGPAQPAACSVSTGALFTAALRALRSSALDVPLMTVSAHSKPGHPGMVHTGLGPGAWGWPCVRRTGAGPGLPFGAPHGDPWTP